MTADTTVGKFDLNIEKILEGWETCQDVQIAQDRDGSWHIRDFRRELRP
jgi:hypothetical protein